MSAIVVALYFWAYFADDVKSISSALLVSDTAAALAGLTAIVSFISYLWVPKKYTLYAALLVYGLLVATTSLLILNTGGTTSPFIALWMLTAVFAGIFGARGLIPMLLLVNSYLVVQYLSSGSISRETIVTVILAGELPLLASFLIWHRKSAGASDKDRAYRDLANELSEVASKSEVVINAIADGVIAIDNQGVIQLINPAAQRILGWDKQDAVTLSYKSVLNLSDKAGAEVVEATDPIQHVLADNKPQRTNDLSLTTKSGKKLSISLVASPIGQIGSGAIIVFRDITKEKAEEREQAEFISTASHEMRTPVASIEGYLGLTLNPATAQIDDKARDFITKAHESAQHLGRLFQDLLDVSKAEDGRLSNNPKVIDVVSYIHDIAQGLRPRAEEKGLRMLYKPLPDGEADQARRLTPVFYVNLDNDHLREVVSNLIENAIKYTPHGDVVIDVGGDAEHVVVSISDSGIGIPAEDIPHLFQKFYRVDNSDTREIGGTGLGLYLCRRLAETMGGRIRVESEYKKGSTFYLEVPRISHEEATALIEKATEQAPAIEPITQTNWQPAATPVAAPIVAQPQPQPLPQQPVAPAPVFTQQPAPQQAPQQLVTPAPQQVQPIPAPLTTQPTSYTNTPLTHIEQNPTQYVAQRPQGVAVPPRDQSQIQQ
ncbi:Sensor histidine kinase YycG [compost metagenome]